MTKSVADAASMLQVMAGPDPKDQTTAREAVPDYAKALTGDVTGMRIGVPTNYFFEGGNAEEIAATRAALDHLKQMGATLVDVSVPHANLAGSAGWIIAMAEGACFHEKRLKEHPELFDPLVRERLEAARFYPATDYIKSMRIRTILIEEMRLVLQKCDVMAVPGGAPAGKLESADAARSDVKPGSKSTPFRGGTTFLGDMTGLPAMTIPCGFTQGPPALPLAIQFYAKPFDESALFRVSHAYESTTDWHKRRPPLSV
jgi:aspartyl-tRNA(Asn)/glutamyl-tRNA(Gln) amidotransferase subunit A